MMKTLKRRLGMDMWGYSHKCKDAFSKIRTLLAFRDICVCYLEKIKKNESKDDSKKKMVKIPSSGDFKINDVIETNIGQISHLLNYHNTITKFNMDVNEYFYNKPYLEEYLCSFGTYEENLFEKQFKIIKQISILFKREKYFKRKKIQNFCVTFSEFSYKSVTNELNKIMMTSLQIIDREYLDEDFKNKRRRSLLKTIFIVIILISSYIFLFILVTDIYNKYEENIFKICISPLLTVVFSKYIITQSIMIFVHSFFMFYFGEKFYKDNRKTLNPLGIVFRYVIPGVSKANHKGLLTFRNFYEKY